VNANWKCGIEGEGIKKARLAEGIEAPRSKKGTTLPGRAVEGTESQKEGPPKSLGSTCSSTSIRRKGDFGKEPPGGKRPPRRGSQRGKESSCEISRETLIGKREK